MGAVSTVGFTTSYYCSFAVYLLHVPAYVEACSVPVDVRASICHATHLLKHRGMTGLGKGDVHGLAATCFCGCSVYQMGMGNSCWTLATSFSLG